MPAEVDPLVAPPAVTGALRCRLCGSNDARRVSDRLRFDPANVPRMRPYRCQSCGLVFLHPPMSANQQRDFYSGEFRRLYHGDDYDLPAFHAQRGPDAARRRQRLKDSGLLHGEVLEIGSSTGRFLQEVSHDVTSCVGVEPDNAQRTFANARDVPTYADLSGLPSGRQYDLVALFHVLEHTRDPVAFLRAAVERLKPTGALVVEVPNVEDVLLSRYGLAAYDGFYWHPAHSYYFSNSTLHRVAAAAGLNAQVEGMQRYTLSNHLHWAARGTAGGQDWLADLVSPATERSYAADLCRRFVCDTLWMVARRATA